MGYIFASTLGIGPMTAEPVCVVERAGLAFVLQAATVEAALLSLTMSTWVVWEGTAATGLAVFPGWFHTFLTCCTMLPFSAVLGWADVAFSTVLVEGRDKSLT